MAVYTETKTYHTKAHMGMIDITDDFRAAVHNACRNTGIRSGIITGFTTGGVAGLTTLEFEPGMVYHDLKAAMDVFSPYTDETGRVIHYQHHDTWHDDNGSSHIKAALLSPFIVIPFVDGEITIGPWQNLTLVECDTRNRTRDVVFQVMGE
ncbi:YjbQ family protein [Agathobaculum sp.]|uniref:YjbQ family protein n=1 Tax=Agathobaculum sp. TaxID=2048138 RepID=UPI0025CE165F|nr:YjbQ family protein [Agathobaculum sp.]